MGAVLAEIGKKLAERWLTLLLLPGALYLATVATAVTLGHGRALDLAYLVERASTWAGHPTTTTPAGQVLVMGAVLAAAGAAGLAGQGLGSVVERVWLASEWYAWPEPARWVAARMVARRARRWRSASDHWRGTREEAARARARGERVDPTKRYAARARMLRIAAAEPTRPTWCGDRLNAATLHLEHGFGIDVAVVWPHLWLLLPGDARDEVIAAREALARSTTLTAWSLLSLPLTALWWPAALVSLVLAWAGHRGTRFACDAYATVLEAVIRLHITDLARRTGVVESGVFDADTGYELTRLLRGETSPTVLPSEANTGTNPGAAGDS
ncbi:hypothetical protein [Halostreptopolyspora alba]|uniref:Vegetative cell wall protein gp1 n=1 Tax=Halostreptopolyspora alba TaxID=2487137 RepID=A0A3N0E3Q8_9ACTN|nr:hypothetical protein EFW17_19175 [Nocardiopsaceae bacterium YIM 96095]